MMRSKSLSFNMSVNKKNEKSHEENVFLKFFKCCSCFCAFKKIFCCICNNCSLKINVLGT